MSHWTISKGLPEDVCSRGGHPIPRIQPMRIVAGNIRLCADHCSWPVDWEAVDAARRDMDAQPHIVSAVASRGLDRFLEDHAGVRRPKPFADVADDLPPDWSDR